MVALWYSARGITGLRGIILGFGSFPVLIGSLLSVILRRKVGFAVTSKQRSGKRSLALSAGVLLLLLALYRRSLLGNPGQGPGTDRALHQRSVGRLLNADAG